MKSPGGLASPERFGSWATGRDVAPASVVRLLTLYLRSRRAGWTLLVVALLAPCSWAGTAWLISRPEVGVGRGALVPLLAFVTLAAAGVISAGSSSPFGDVERTVARPLPPLRLCHLAGLLSAAAVLLAAVLLTFDLAGAWPDPLPALLRNLAGFSGMALLTAWLAGARLSWTIPTTFGIGAYLAARRPDDSFAPWAWQMQPGQDVLSWTVALLLLAAGFGFACLHGPREAAEERE